MYVPGVAMSVTRRVMSSSPMLDQQIHSRPPGTASRDAFNHAGDVFNYVSAKMPKGEKAGSLTPAAYWAVTSFILTGHGAPVPAEGVTPANADGIPVEPK